MNRRHFFGTLLTPFLAKLVPAPVPQTTWRLDLPPQTPYTFGFSGFAPAPISLDEINAVTARVIMPAVSDAFFREPPLLRYLQERS